MGICRVLRPALSHPSSPIPPSLSILAPLPLRKIYTCAVAIPSWLQAYSKQPCAAPHFTAPPL